MIRAIWQKAANFMADLSKQAVASDPSAMGARTVSVGTNPAQNIIEKVNLDNRGNLCFGDTCFPLRDVQAIELIHSIEDDNDEFVEIYVGTKDRGRRLLHSRLAIKRNFVGVTTTDGPAANELRTNVRGMRVPIIEI